MSKQILIGCSGYYYPLWKNDFYPRKLPASQWLKYYSAFFNSVELNGTFYRTPVLAALKKQAKLTPADFRFSVKMSRYITHVQRLKECRTLVREFNELVEEGLAGKLHRILVQMPPSFHFTPENCDRILETGLSQKYVLELRHPSWWTDPALQFVRKLDCIFCNVDLPGLDVPFISDQEECYIRLHGVPELFKSSYAEKRLEEIAELITPDTQKISVYFNNTWYGAGWRNARTMMRVIRDRSL